MDTKTWLRKVVLRVAPTLTELEAQREGRATGRAAALHL